MKFSVRVKERRKKNEVAEERKEQLQKVSGLKEYLGLFLLEFCFAAPILPRAGGVGYEKKKKR